MLRSLCSLRSLRASCRIARLSTWTLWGGMRSTRMPDLGARAELQSGRRLRPRAWGHGLGPDRGRNRSPVVHCRVTG